ncbi:MAG TPA: ubiquinol-cytochrome c reductase iron-sulfur subunit [Kofleriaceae bacterium]|nr:ubiquinol-cytochrome c reductase iron-sulfur subunit [Kofleriaceae bacterium]
MADDDEPPREDRRRFLKVATCALGGGIGITVAAPAVSYLLHPVGTRTVTAAAEPIDAVAVDALGTRPVRVPLRARSLRDAWTSTNDVPLGAAWVRRDEKGDVHALSSVCPHLGCAVAFSQPTGDFRCPCHDSAFSVTGEYRRGPAERGLDPLPLEVKDGRVYITWVRFRAGGSSREPA